MTVAEIAALCGGRLGGRRQRGGYGLYTDSRETQPGKMFVPIRGEKTDAHRFIPQVFAAGAAATFSEDPRRSGRPGRLRSRFARARCKGSRRATASASRSLVIGITGSVGNDDEGDGRAGCFGGA